VARSGATADAIMREAATLFTRKGFHGTSTREIADAVGIRQPSLFHHFESKAEIAKALLEYDRKRSPGLSGHLDLPDAPPPVRLYQGVRREVQVELTSDYDLRGLYLSSILDEPEFEPWKKAVDRSLAQTTATIRDGIATGDFIDQDPTLAVDVIDAVINQAVRWTPDQPQRVRPSDMAALIMRLVLKRPSRIPAIHRQADAALRAAGISWDEGSPAA
jgi:AcrR family transcriptional regulator